MPVESFNDGDDTLYRFYQMLRKGVNQSFVAGHAWPASSASAFHASSDAVHGTVKFEIDAVEEGPTEALCLCLYCFRF